MGEKMSKKTGAVLAMTVGFVLVFTMFGLSAIHISGLQKINSGKQVAATQAFWLAEAGIQKTIDQLNNGGLVSAEWEETESGSNIFESKEPLTINSQGYFEISVDELDSAFPEITSYGYIPIVGADANKEAKNYAQRNIRVTMYENAFHFGVLGDDLVRIQQSDNAFIDSDVASNKNITTEGQVIVDGDVYYGPEGEFVYKDKLVTINGETTQNDNPIPLPDVVVPQELVDLTYSTLTPPTLSSGNYKFESFKLTGDLTIEGTANIYITSTLEITGGQFIIEGGGAVNIYVDGDVNIGGNAMVNTEGTPANLILYSNEEITIKFSGGAEFYGAVYAPHAEINISGTAQETKIYGAIVGNTINFKGNYTLEYDENLENVVYADKRYSLYSWREIY